MSWRGPGHHGAALRCRFSTTALPAVHADDGMPGRQKPGQNVAAPNQVGVTTVTGSEGVVTGRSPRGPGSSDI